MSDDNDSRDSWIACSGPDRWMYMKNRKMLWLWIPDFSDGSYFWKKPLMKTDFYQRPVRDIGIVLLFYQKRMAYFCVENTGWHGDTAACRLWSYSAKDMKASYLGPSADRRRSDDWRILQLPLSDQLITTVATWVESYKPKTWVLSRPP